MPAIREIYLVLAIPALIGLAAIPAQAGELPVRVGNGSFSLPVTSVTESRFKTVVKQRYDYSCGAAAIATLLSHHYDEPTAEKGVFLEMYEIGDKEKIKQAGFSLLDMKGYLERKGWRADGYELSLEKFSTARIPAISIINTNGYRHFVVIKGINENEILVGDPALGAKIYKRPDFEAIWEGVIFVIRDKIDVGQSHFNAKSEWRVREDAPFGTARTRANLGVFTLLLPAGNEF
ncbi:MAG: C39 family peptidase [Proteobacteria bacterium]|nr:C39 family peptidase [Pseudomonadota bacterium]